MRPRRGSPHGFAAVVPYRFRYRRRAWIASVVVPIIAMRIRRSVAEGIRRVPGLLERGRRSEEHTSELQSLMRNSYAVFCLKKKTNNKQQTLSNILVQTYYYSMIET